MQVLLAVMPQQKDVYENIHYFHVFNNEIHIPGTGVHWMDKAGYKSTLLLLVDFGVYIFHDQE
jgi:hypothetical protein